MHYALRCLQLIYSALLPCISIAQQTVRKGKKNTPNLHLLRSRENRSLLGSNNLHFLTAALCDERKGKRSKWRRGQSPSKAGALLGAARGGGSGCAPFSAWKCIPAKGTVLLYNVLCCGGATAPSLCEKCCSIYSQGISSAS